jgi:hypothetical protein
LKVFQTPAAPAANEPVKPKPAPTDPGEELVEIYIPKGEGELKYNVRLEVQGEWVDIPRGKPFKVKRKFRDLYRANRAQESRADRYIDKLTATNERGELINNAKDVRPE